ncbi:hypothetical protein PG990_014088 [Apiospora arundinis]
MEQPPAIELQNLAFTSNGNHEVGTDYNILDAMGYDLGGKPISRMDPYLKWIKSSSPGRRDEEYLRLFIDVVLHFKRGDQSHHDAIQLYIDGLANGQPHHYYFHNTSPGSAERRTSVEDTVLIIIGVWTLMKPYFVPTRGRQKRVVLSFCLKSGIPYSQANAFNQSPSKLIQSCGLLPQPDESILLTETAQGLASCATVQSSNSRTADFSFGLHASLVESHSISPRVLNARRLYSLAGVRIMWTENLSRHLLLSKAGQKHYLELFALPCTLQGRGLEGLQMAGITPNLVYEIQATYANLFNPVRISSTHSMLMAYTGIRYCCWCVCCASWRFRAREIKRLSQEPPRNLGTRVPYDPEIKHLMRQHPTSWAQDEFPDLWPRILEIDHYLQAARPWNFWILFRDNRDTVQYWTFL